MHTSACIEMNSKLLSVEKINNMMCLCAGRQTLRRQVVNKPVIDKIVYNNFLTELNSFTALPMPSTHIELHKGNDQGVGII